MGTALDKPILSKRESLAKLLAWKAEYVRRPEMKLDVYRNILAVEKTLRFRIQKDEKNATSA